MATEIIHARSMVYEGHAYSPWGAGYGKRVYKERRLPNGQIELVCGAGLDDVHAVAPSSWATLKSKKSRDAKLVTCPECAALIRAAGFAHAPAMKGPTNA
jgi:hypothetical protein